MKKHKLTWLLLLVFAYFTIGLMSPPTMCEMPAAPKNIQVLYHAPHLDSPFMTAIRAIGTFYQQPSCFAPVDVVSNQHGWSYTTTEVLRQRGYQSFLLWIYLLCGISALNLLWVIVGALYLKRKR